jgi:hypothetical protein
MLSCSCAFGIPVSPIQKNVLRGNGNDESFEIAAEIDVALSHITEEENSKEEQLQNKNNAIDKEDGNANSSISLFGDDFEEENFLREIDEFEKLHGSKKEKKEESSEMQEDVSNSLALDSSHSNDSIDITNDEDEFNDSLNDKNIQEKICIGIGTIFHCKMKHFRLLSDLVKVRPKNYPNIPIFNCPKKLMARLKELSFTTRLIIETLISNGDISWDFIDEAIIISFLICSIINFYF